MLNILLFNLKTNVKKLTEQLSIDLRNSLTRFKNKKITQKLSITQLIQLLPEGTHKLSEYETLTIRNTQEVKAVYNNYDTEEKFDISYNTHSLYKGIDKCYYLSLNQESKLVYFCHTLISGEPNNNNDKINKNPSNMKLVEKVEYTILKSAQQLSHLINI
jgi:hypothetical protein